MAVVVPPEDPPRITGDLRVVSSDGSRPIHNDNNAGVPPRWADLEVSLLPSDADTDLNWLSVISWQGGDFFGTQMVKGADGVYRTTEPVPVYGNWKTGIRLHMPHDPAIQAPAYAAESGTRVFGPERELLQRERKPGFRSGRGPPGSSAPCGSRPGSCGRGCTRLPPPAPWLLECSDHGTGVGSVGGHRNLPTAGHHVATSVMTEGKPSLGSSALGPAPVVAVSPSLSTRYLMPVNDIDCSNCTLVERGARTYRRHRKALTYVPG